MILQHFKWIASELSVSNRRVMLPFMQVLVAQKDAELESMRQRMSGSRSQASEQSQPQQVQRRREEMGPSEGDRSQPRPDKYLMTGRWTTLSIQNCLEGDTELMLSPSSRRSSAIQAPSS